MIYLGYGRVEGRLHWSEVQVVYGSLRDILRGKETMKPTGREYIFVAGNFVTLPELSILKSANFVSRHAWIAKEDQYREA